MSYVGSYPPAPGGSCGAAPTPAALLSPEMPGGCAATTASSGLRRPSHKRRLRERGPAGMPGSAWGAPSLGGSLLWRGRRDSGQCKPYNRHRPTEGLVQGAAGLTLDASWRSSEAQPGGGMGMCPLGSRTDFPRCTQMGSRKPSIQQSRVSVTVSVRLLGWSPMRRVIPKLFLITFLIGGE